MLMYTFEKIDLLRQDRQGKDKADSLLLYHESRCHSSQINMSRIDFLEKHEEVGKISENTNTSYYTWIKQWLTKRGE